MLWYRLIILQVVLTQMKSLNAHVELDTGLILDLIFLLVNFILVANNNLNLTKWSHM